MLNGDCWLCERCSWLKTMRRSSVIFSERLSSWSEPYTRQSWCQKCRTFWRRSMITTSWMSRSSLNGTRRSFLELVLQSLISAPSLGVYYFLSLTLSVCMSVCHKHCFFFFVSRCNRAISWPSVLHDKNYKTLFLDSWFRPPNAQNLLPQIACDNATLPRRHPWSRCRRGMQLCLGKSAIHWQICHKFGQGAEIQSPTDFRGFPGRIARKVWEFEIGQGSCE